MRSTWRSRAGARGSVAAALTGTLAAAAFATGGDPAPARAQGESPCIGDLEAKDVSPRPGQRLRFGITPGVQTGQVGPLPAVAKPEVPARTHAALGSLRPRRGPFVVRLNRFFWSEGEAGIRRFLALARRYTSRGYLVELQLRYHPNRRQEGDTGAWTRHVRDVVRRFGPNRRVVAIQVTNEVNLAFSADSSDGAYRGARAALVDGVIAAKDEARRRGHRQLEIGFNWFYRLDPVTEQLFWQGLRDRGGRAFARAVDWIGLDAYPGTFFPPAESEGGERDGMVNAMSVMRCFARIPGIPASVPMHVEENGWPTQPPRSYDRQAATLRTMVRAVHDYRGNYNVTDYRWFNLRDADSSSPMLAQRYGLMEDDYSPKPAFSVYRDLIEALSIRPRASGSPSRTGRARPRLRLRLSYRRRGRTRSGRRCARSRVRATLVGRDRGKVRRALFARGRRVFRLDRRRPFSRIVHRRHRGRAHRHRVRVRVRMKDGRRVRLRRSFRACRRR